MVQLLFLGGIDPAPPATLTSPCCRRAALFIAAHSGTQRAGRNVFSAKSHLPSHWFRARTQRNTKSRNTPADAASLQKTRQVTYRVNATVVARARQSVTTLTRAGLPAATAAFARSSAGLISSGDSTHSPCPPSASAIRSNLV